MTPDILTKSLELAAYTLHNTSVGESLHAFSADDSEMNIGAKFSIGFALATFAFIYIASRMLKRDIENFSRPKGEESKSPASLEQKPVREFIKVLPSTGQATSRPTRFFPNGKSAMTEKAPREDEPFYEK
jgi:hypothetical protein